MISTLHGPFDDRIYWKEALSLKRKGFDVIHLCVGDRYSDFVSDEGIRIISIRKPRRARNPYLDILLGRLTGGSDITGKLLEVCRGLKAHVYHYHDQQVNKIAEVLKRLPQEPGLIYDVHEDYQDQIIAYHRSGWLAPFARWHASRVRKRELKMAKLCDAVIAAVPHIAEIFSHCVAPSRLHVVYNYTTLYPEKVPLPEERTWDAVYAGLINDSRCGLEMIETAALVREKLPGFRMLLVGPVSGAGYRQKLGRRIRDLRLSGNVVLKEAVPYSQMEQILLQSKVGMGLFKPLSLFRYGIQVKTFEYMACGLPVICSHSGAIHDIVSRHACGISVDPSSAEETANALVRILTDRDLWQTCSNNGRSAVRERYNWASEEKKLIALFDAMPKT